ncbi:MAG TPA: HAD hydrolase family protein [Bacteroidales bacterium]|nr:HAD hydrolase family protein [Bacteroidales bacterium]HPS16848.1 HAD hydrolase family protein [Bacteroidales bacterium]
MISINIPGVKELQLCFLVLDFNGTLAFDGNLLEGVAEKLNVLAADLEIHVITADTFGKAKAQFKNIKCKVKIIEGEEQQSQKLDFIAQLGADEVVAIGNGKNDALMLKHAALGIAIIQKEGIAGETLLSADVVCNDILDALDLLDNPLRLTATLRK